MARCINHPSLIALHFHEDHTYCDVCHEYFKAKLDLHIIHTWDKPLFLEDSKEEVKIYQDKIKKAANKVQEAIEKILRTD